MMHANTSGKLLAHELGHTLGLGHEESDTTNIMYPKVTQTNITDDQCQIINRSKLIQQEFLPVAFIPEFPKRFEVEILSMGVHEVDDGVELDNDLEIRWYFNINGTELQWEHHQIEDGPIPYHIGVRTIVSINNPSDVITISITGKEFDKLSPDDKLPEFSKTFNQNSTWGTNPQGVLSTSIIENPEIKCEIFYKITALPSEEVPIQGFCPRAVI
ncbi:MULTISPECIES: matrixin family metalloprotease [Bacillus cereus group]|nr:matrixin family metalloprotease [Bacillus cereus]MDA1995940.1 hypothetical protein [Bacillus cereus]MDA2001873.1 hypothetical protein [Bacillus cereus]MDA3654514.1 hypothetical protein [Bacillus cereus]WPQ44004.1 hypothetical protein SH594_30090 [Bacillus cereus]